MRKSKQVYKIAVTGHRPSRLPGGYDFIPSNNVVTGETLHLAEIFRDIILDAVEKHGKVECIHGAALGVDQLFAMVAVKLKLAGYPVMVHTAVPFKNHGSNWQAPADLNRRDAIEHHSDEVHLCDEGYYTSPRQLQARNEYMIDRCDELIAVWDLERKGGTYNAVSYGLDNDKAVYFVVIKDNKFSYNRG